MEPAWLRAAYIELRHGVREVPGAEANARIIEYHRSTSLKATSDEVAWCAAFVGWALHKAGTVATGSAAARSYIGWGVGVSLRHPPIGAMVVLARGEGPQPGPEVRDAQGHVGFFWSHGGPGELVVLGGNQGDRVSLATYPVHRLLGVRWAA